MALVIERPDQKVVGFGDGQICNLGTQKETKSALAPVRRKCGNRDDTIKKEHEPVPGALVVLFGNIGKETKILFGNAQTSLLESFADRTLIG